ncbi:hypothetical protein SAMN05216319_4038 [Duganella sp. CF402]|uniref:hypothetical protein n=1 Tax=unclassified Duganella TaxID=2636909 RepID=UPI0008CBBAFE|nr:MULTISPECIES: hypothetical protein [unclassified Duganella]RZT04185.1 hypothetical protein EV582_5067 [Duganella sp. BK701]SEM45001.1 hypothetical protein SAMN05216319_4038 [Duganella sp. CF402]
MEKLSQKSFLWILQGICAIHRKPFSAELAQQQLAAPYTVDALQKALGVFGFDAASRSVKALHLHQEAFPLMAWMSTQEENVEAALSPALILQADQVSVLVAEAGDATR